MESLKTKLDELNRQFQQITVWQPNKQEPLDELERWRVNSHLYIEQIYERKRFELERTIKAHEQCFMREIMKQRRILKSIQMRVNDKIKRAEQGYLLSNDEQHSLLTELQNLKVEIDTKLCQGEIIVKIIPTDLNQTIKIGYKIQHSHSRVPLTRNKSPIKQKQTAEQKSREEVTTYEFSKWKERKDENIRLARQMERTENLQKFERDRADKEGRRTFAKQAFDQWYKSKKEAGLFRNTKLTTGYENFD